VDHLQLWRFNETFFNFRVLNKQFVGISNQGGNKIVAVSNSPSNQETFQIIRNTDDPLKIRIRASNGLFLQVLITPFSSHSIWKFLIKSYL
jgi:hypothetical protein